MAVLGLGLLLPLASASAAPAGSTALVAISPASQAHDSGTPFTFNLAFSCQGVAGASCGPNVRVELPIDTTTHPSMASWAYAASSSTPGLITAGPRVEGDRLVIELSSERFVAGFSGTLRLTATPPNSTTHANTSFDLRPTLSGDGIASVAAPAKASGLVTAKPLVSVAKATADGGSVYEVGAKVTFNITARCSPTSSGNLFVATGSIVDRLPADLVYVSSSPPGGVYDPVAHSVTWDLSKAKPGEMPPGCSANASGTSAYQVVATAPASVPAVPLLTNTVDFTGTGPDEANPAGVSSTTSASAKVQVVAFPPVGPGAGYATVSKTALAPIAQPGIVSDNQYVATYAGDWVPVVKAPRYQVGAAAASFRTQVSYGLVGRYLTDYYDPLPCFDNVAGNVYSSAAYTDAACANPAFHLQVFSVTSTGADPSVEGLGQAYAAGWRPELVLSDGSTAKLNANATVKPTDAAAFFTVPAGVEVATVRLPPNLKLRNRAIMLTHWGYVDASLVTANGGINQLRNTATAVPQLVAGTPLAPVSRSADLFTVPKQVGLGISKAFGPLGQGGGGHTELQVSASVTTPTPLVRDLVITDLLPSGLAWENPVASMPVTVSFNAGAATKTATAAVTYLRSYQYSGRDLIRIRVDHAAFNQAGSYVVTLGAKALLVTTPKALGVYPNTDQAFLYGLAPEQIYNVCATPTQVTGGISSASFQSDNALDLAGDGQLSEDYCQASASLKVTGNGAAFALTKTVQGNLDDIPRGPLGIGNASPSGTATYVLGWTNVGSDTLTNPVIYDVMAYVGDVGVSEGQATVPRGSRFATVLESVGSLPAGVSVEYSASTNPCRNEVFPDASNPACVDDWTATPPALPSVKALRFVASGDYAAGSAFAVSFTVSLPPSALNQVAWNAAATNATDKTDPASQTLPAEPPKVGIKATSPPRFTTGVSRPAAKPGEGVVDLVELRGVGSSSVDVAWTLYGPLPPVAGSCDGLNWSGAAVADAGSDTWIDGDGDYEVGPVKPTELGCYAFAYELTDADYAPSPITMAAGAANELFEVEPFTPRISTVAKLEAAGRPGAYLLADHITLAGSGLSAANPAQLTWKLVGPLPPVSGSCNGVDWSTAPQRASGSISVDGDGSYVSPPTEVSAPGCYSFHERLPGASGRAEAKTSPGVPEETHLITAAAEPGGGASSGGLASTGAMLWMSTLLGFALCGLGLGLAGLARRRR